MGHLRIAPKTLLNKGVSKEAEKSSSKPSKAPVQQAILPIGDSAVLRVSNPQFQNLNINEKIVYIDKPFEIIKEVFVNVIKEIHVPFEVIKIEEKIVEVIKEIPIEIQVFQDKIVEIEKFIDREILKTKVPIWMLALVLCETLTIIGLIIKLI